MPVTKVEQLPGEPIFHIAYEGEMTAEDLRASTELLATFWSDALKTSGSHILLDARNVSKIAFAESIKSFTVTRAIEADFAEMMPYVHYYVVGTNAMAKLWVNWRRMQSGKSVPMFAHLDDALAAARTRIASIAAGESSETET